MRWLRDRRVRRRVRSNLALAPLPDAALTPAGAIAWRHLFSLLAHLEELAVLAAERGDGIPGQLEDELVHRDTFAALAGDVAPCPEPVADLHRWLAGLEGVESLAALNVVAEAWLESLFREVAGWPVAPALFEAVGAEEARHVSDARAKTGAMGAAVAETVRGIESRLLAIVRDPSFGLPLLYFGGRRGLARVALRAYERHREACAHLGVAPGGDLRELVAGARAALADRDDPRALARTAWEETAEGLWPAGPAPMLHWEDVPAPWAHGATAAALEARAVRAVARALAHEPRSHVTRRPGQSFRPARPVVGVRRLHDASRRLVMTVHVADAHRIELPALLRLLARRATRMRAEPYRPGPMGGLGELAALLPPARAAATVSCVGFFGGRSGIAPLVELEGAPIAVTVGEPVMRPAWIEAEGRYLPRPHVFVGVAFDHRAGNGEELCRFARALADGIEGGCA